MVGRALDGARAALSRRAPAGSAPVAFGFVSDLSDQRALIEAGGPQKYHDANTAKAKLFARERIRLLVDEDSFVEDGFFANALAGDLPADGVVTGIAQVDGRPVAMMANDSTVKAGSWGARTVEKIVRIIEEAYRLGIPMVWLVDSAGARITDQVQMFPGPSRRREGLRDPGAGQSGRSRRSVRCSGRARPVAPTSRRSATWWSWSRATRRCTSARPRMVEMVTGEITTLEEMGGARMHCTVSGVGHFLAPDEPTAIETVRRHLSYLPSNWQQQPPAFDAAAGRARRSRAMIPDQRAAGVRHARATSRRSSTRAPCSRSMSFGRASCWSDSPGWTARSIGIVANNPMYKGGVLFVDSADKATRFIELCDAFNVPLLFLADVPGLHGRRRRSSARASSGTARR